MDRAEAAGFGIAAAGHVALLAVLSAGIATAVTAPAPPIQSIEVSFAEDVGLINASPDPAVEPPAQSMAPDAGPPEEAAPAPAPEPEPAPPQPAPPEPAPPQPKQAAPAPPQPQPQPQPKQAPPAPQPKQAAPAPAPKQERAAPAPKAPAPAVKQAEAGTGTAERPRGSRLGPDLLKGIGSDPSPSRETRQPGAVMSAQAVADIGSAITRQVQPCANRQVNPGPGANRIATAINLRLNRDGSLAAPPRVVRQSGVDDENRRYAERVADLAVATFVGCSPLRGLPPELYDVANGWSNFTMNYRLPG